MGDHWARVSEGGVEQCSCIESQARCEGTRHTGMSRPASRRPRVPWYVGAVSHNPLAGTSSSLKPKVTQQQGHRERAEFWPLHEFLETRFSF